jgi:hypothetical protein
VLTCGPRSHWTLQKEYDFILLQSFIEVADEGEEILENAEGNKP